MLVGTFEVVVGLCWGHPGGLFGLGVCLFCHVRLGWREPLGSRMLGGSRLGCPLTGERKTFHVGSRLLTIFRFVKNGSRMIEDDAFRVLVSRKVTHRVKMNRGSSSRIATYVF